MNKYAKIEPFVAIFKKARAIMENTFVTTLAKGKVNPIGSIFLLKNFFGYRDSTEVVHRQETISDVLSSAFKRGDLIDGEVVESAPVLAQPSEE